MTISSLLRTQSNTFAEKIAVKHGVNALTYYQLNKKAAQVAQYIGAKGFKTNYVAALAVDRSSEMIIFLLAFVKAGITYLPVDPNLPADRIAYMMDDAGVKLLVTSKKTAEHFSIKTSVIYMEDAIAASDDHNGDADDSDHDPAGIAYILYTSGSTGRPKGVLVKRSGLLNLLLSIQQEPGITANDIMLLSTTISFDIAELEVFLPLISGATLVIADAETSKDGRALLDIARKENITIMQGTPFMWRIMLEAGWEGKLPLKAFCGGEAMSKDLAQQLFSHCNEAWNMYGPTETTIYSVIKKITGNEEVITIGRPIKNTTVYLLDEHLSPVAEGCDGEIYIGGSGVAEGYINKPDLTAERFIDDNFGDNPGNKLYKTGDIGRILPGGDIQCLGRSDHQIKIRGYRIEAEEIEALLKQSAGITGALVMLYTDHAGNEHLVAYVVPKQLFSENETAYYISIWKELLSQKLPVYMIPDIFMPVAGIPVLPNGKTDRNALPEPVIFKSEKQYIPPTTSTEKALAAIFLKNIAIERLGINDKFLTLGIDSLVMVKIMMQIEKEFGRRYPLSVLLEYFTLQKLAWLVDNNADVATNRSLIAIKPGGDKIPLYIVHGIGLNLMNLYSMATMLDAGQPVYGLQATGLDGTETPFDSIEEIASRYNQEILAHNPSGPYAISGYSFGGYIAYEMVKQLKANGKDVRMLAMFDTNLQVPVGGLSSYKKVNVKIRRQFKKVFFRIGTLFSQPLRTAKYLIKYIPAYFYDNLSSRVLRKTRSPVNVPGHMLDIMNRLYKAFDNYVFKPFDVKIILFRAAIKIYYIDDPIYLGWKRLALKGVDVLIVPGDHKEMFSAPNDKILARSLQEQLNKMELEAY